MFTGTPLTVIEQHLLHALDSGASNKHLARHLGKSEYTIRNQLSRFFKKVKVSNRTQAACWFREYLASKELKMLVVHPYHCIIRKTLQKFPTKSFARKLVKQLQRGSEMQSMCDTGTAVGAAWNFQVKPAGTVIASGNGSKRDWVAGADGNLLGEAGDKFQITPSAGYQSTDSADTTNIVSNSCGINGHDGGARGASVPDKEKVAQKIYAVKGVAVRSHSTVTEIRFDTKVQAANSTNWRAVA